MRDNLTYLLFCSSFFVVFCCCVSLCCDNRAVRRWISLARFCAGKWARRLLGDGDLLIFAVSLAAAGVSLARRPFITNAPRSVALVPAAVVLAAAFALVIPNGMAKEFVRLTKKEREKKARLGRLAVGSKSSVGARFRLSSLFNACC